MDRRTWRGLVCNRYTTVPQFRVAVKGSCPDAGPQIYWEQSLAVVADAVWDFLVARGSRPEVFATIAGVPVTGEVTVDAAKLQVMEAVAVHRGERDAMGPRLSIYVEVSVAGWSPQTRGEILEWLVEVGVTDAAIYHGVTLRFRPPTPTPAPAGVGYGPSLRCPG